MAKEERPLEVKRVGLVEYRYASDHRVIAFSGQLVGFSTDGDLCIDIYSDIGMSVDALHEVVVSEEGNYEERPVAGTSQTKDLRTVQATILIPRYRIRDFFTYLQAVEERYKRIEEKADRTVQDSEEQT